MKRKFSFNLPTVKVPLRSDSLPKHAPEPAPSHVASQHRTHRSKDSVTSVNTSLISRRPLNQKTEQELRAACALILQNFKPSDHAFADADPKLDFNGPHTRRREQRTDASQIRVHKPTGAPAAADVKALHDARKQSRRSETAAVKGHPEAPAEANTGRRRAEQTSDKEMETRGRVRSPKLATVRHDVDSDDAKSLSTPLTASTDAQINNGSTAPTSVAVSSRISSQRTSHQYETAASVADAQAAEWMRQELEKRRTQMASQPLPDPPKSSHRPPSRSNSIKAGIKGYMFPGSTSASRSHSQDSLHTVNSQSSSQPGRSGSTRGWRSWGLPRKSSSRASSRPATSDGQSERAEKEKKAEVNLNRELPPLPSLDTWVSEQKKKEHQKPQAQGAHIATLMRPQDQQQEYAAAVRKHRHSGSDTQAIRPANVHSSSHTKSSAHLPPRLAASSLDPTMDFDHMMSAMSSPRTLDEQPKLHVNGHVPQHSASIVSHSQSAKVSMDGRLNAPNFSRKISTEVPRPQRALAHESTRYENVVHISGHVQKEEQKGRLRKVFSGWMLKKDKKEDWMGRIEKGGVKGGIMTQDQAALPPVVRY